MGKEGRGLAEAGSPSDPPTPQARSRGRAWLLCPSETSPRLGAGRAAGRFLSGGVRGGPSKARGLWWPPQPLLESTLSAGPAKRTPRGDRAVQGSASRCPSQMSPGDSRGCHGDTIPYS